MFRFCVIAAALAATTVASAHFPWLYVTEDSEPRLFFGEGLEARDYHVPDAAAAAEVWQDAIDAPAKRLVMEPLEEEGFTGLEGDHAIEPRGVVKTTIDYGLYHGSRLTYDAQHFPAENPQAWPTAVPSEGGLRATLRVAGDRLMVTLLLNNKPLPGAKATLSHEEGGDGIEATADEAGVARFAMASVKDGLNGLMVMHVDKDAAGEVDGKPYTSETRILTATFNYQAEEAAKVSALTPVPEAVSSFGAAVSEGWLYVYGGHTGQAHDHSRGNLSGHLRRIRLDGGVDWEELPAGPPLQGLPLVAHGGKLYRLGGLDARNASGEEEDLHSVDHFSCYDPATGAWTDLVPLPGPRSSHNAVVVGDTLYVVGGWALDGDSEGTWQDGALAYNLTDQDAEWAALPEPPFKRRALAVGHLDGQVVVLCGMTDDMGLSKQVFFYDPAAKAWSEGPEFPGAAFHGFGLSAWNLGGKLYAGGMAGVLYQLSDDRSEWLKVDEFQTKRFFHQLVPDGQGGLLAVAGASPEVGHTGSIERLDLVFAEPAVEEEPTEEGPAEDTGAAAAPPAEEPSKATHGAGAATSEACPADRWPGFRGIGTSVSAATDLPLNWSDEEGVAWRSDLPGYGQSSPVVWGNRVFVTTMQGDEKETPTVLCFDLATGEELWRREYEGTQRVTASNYVSRSAPTPYVDGDRVYAFFESGDVFALTHEGEPVWDRSLVKEYGQIEGSHGIGGSPLLTGPKLIVPMLHDGPSYLVALNTLSGETTWKTDFDARVAWSSPSLAGDSIVMSGAGIVDAFDVETGQPTWSLEDLEGNNVPSPSIAGDLILIGSQERTSNVAYRLSGTETPGVSWRSKAATSSFASPLVYRGNAYFVSKAGVAHCVDATSGELRWKERLPTSCWASPLGSGERVYFFGKDGETVVYATGETAEKVATNQLTVHGGSRLYGIAAVSRQLLLRTGSSLVCIR